jgi:hypothetical protein
MQFVHGKLSEAVHLTFLALHLLHATEALLRGRPRRFGEAINTSVILIKQLISTSLVL